MKKQESTQPTQQPKKQKMAGEPKADMSKETQWKINKINAIGDLKSTLKNKYKLMDTLKRDMEKIKEMAEEHVAFLNNILKELNKGKLKKLKEKEEALEKMESTINGVLLPDYKDIAKFAEEKINDLENRMEKFKRQKDEIEKMASNFSAKIIKSELSKETVEVGIKEMEKNIDRLIEDDELTIQDWEINKIYAKFIGYPNEISTEVLNISKKLLKSENKKLVEIGKLIGYGEKYKLNLGASKSIGVVEIENREEIIKKLKEMNKKAFGLF